jgi:hypothetical protein
MIGCCLHLLENFLYAQQATDWIIQEREKVQEIHYLLSHSPNKDSVVFHCKKLLLVQLSFGNCNLTYFLELYTIVHILRIQQPYSLTSIETIYSDILSLQYDSIQPELNPKQQWWLVFLKVLT